MSDAEAKSKWLDMSEGESVSSGENELIALPLEEKYLQKEPCEPFCFGSNFLYCEKEELAAEVEATVGVRQSAKTGLMMRKGGAVADWKD